jgi:beta-aspartyl-peptidase (threonine type)
MRYIFWMLLLIPVLLFAQTEEERVVLVIHGGAGWITPERFEADEEALITRVMGNALEAGFKVISDGGLAEDAVVAAIQIMEEDSNFNAGIGAVFTHEETNDLDASIMRGKDLNAGAVAGVRTIKSPIEAAMAVMNESPHVMLAGTGAEEFAEDIGLDMVEPSYFYTRSAFDYLQKVKSNEKNGGSLNGTQDHKFGTVGCVALDAQGDLAAGTSTGGMTNKRWGRIGDSPIIGAGTYANNLTCGVSCTGWGEFFIRNQAAYQVSALMAMAGFSLETATDKVIEDIAAMGAKGGLIALSSQGECHWSFSTPGMFRAYITESGKKVIEFYSEE